MDTVAQHEAFRALTVALEEALKVVLPPAGSGAPTPQSGKPVVDLLTATLLPVFARAMSTGLSFDEITRRLLGRRDADAFYGAIGEMMDQLRRAEADAKRAAAAEAAVRDRAALPVDAGARRQALRTLKLAADAARPSKARPHAARLVIAVRDAVKVGVPLGVALEVLSRAGVPGTRALGAALAHSLACAADAEARARHAISLPEPARAPGDAVDADAHADVPPMRPTVEAASTDVASEADLKGLDEAAAVLGVTFTEPERRAAAHMVTRLRTYAQRSRERAASFRRSLGEGRRLRRPRASRARRRAAHGSALAARDGPPPGDDPPTSASDAGARADQAPAAQNYACAGECLKAAAGPTVEHALAAPRIEAGAVLGVRPLDVDELLAPLAPLNFLSEDLGWCAGRPATLVGVRGCGKTLAIQSAALSLASGTHPIWSRFGVGRRGRVLHLDADHDARATMRRYQRLALGMGLSQDELRGHLRYVPAPEIRLTDPRARDAYRQAVEGWDLCILGSLHSFMFGADDSGARIRDCFEQILMPVSEATGCAFVVLRHLDQAATPMPGNEAAPGSSVSLDGSGAQLHVALTPGQTRRRRNATDAAPELRRVTMTRAACEPATKGLAPFYLDVEDVPDHEGNDLKAGLRVVYRSEEQTETAGRRSDACDQALRYVRARTLAHEAVQGIEDLARAIRVRRQKASEVVDQLQREGLIANEPEQVGHGAPKPRLWAVSAPDFTPPPRSRRTP